MHFGHINTLYECNKLNLNQPIPKVLNLDVFSSVAREDSKITHDYVTCGLDKDNH